MATFSHHQPYKGFITASPFLSSAVSNRLKKYLAALKLNEGETAHSFRAGCSITLSFLGASDAEVASHVGWRSLATAKYYTQTDAVMHTTKTSDLLTGHSHTCGPSPATTNQSLQQLGATFRSRNILQGFSLEFPARSGY